MWQPTKENVCGDESGQWPGWQCDCCCRVVCTNDSDQPKPCGCEPAMAFFTFSHLPSHLQEVSQPFAALARQLCDELQAGPQRTLALTLLLQAKDAAVRSLVRPGG